MKSVYCSLFGHQYQVSKKVTLHVKEYSCKNCNSQLTTDGRGRLTQLTPKYKEINSVLEHIHYKRTIKKQRNLILDR